MRHLNEVDRYVLSRTVPGVRCGSVPWILCQRLHLYVLNEAVCSDDPVSKKMVIFLLNTTADAENKVLSRRNWIHLFREAADHQRADFIHQLSAYAERVGELRAWTAEGNDLMHCWIACIDKRGAPALVRTFLEWYGPQLIAIERDNEWSSERPLTSLVEDVVAGGSDWQDVLSVAGMLQEMDNDSSGGAIFPLAYEKALEGLNVTVMRQRASFDCSEFEEFDRSVEAWRKVSFSCIWDDKSIDALAYVVEEFGMPLDQNPALDAMRIPVLKSLVRHALSYSRETTCYEWIDRHIISRSPGEMVRREMLAPTIFRAMTRRTDKSTGIILLPQFRLLWSLNEYHLEQLPVGKVLSSVSVFMIATDLGNNVRRIDCIAIISAYWPQHIAAIEREVVGIMDHRKYNNHEQVIEALRSKTQMYRNQFGSNRPQKVQRTR